MLSNSIGELGESINGMTLFTVAGNTIIYKLSVVVILMTIGTPVMLQRVSEFCLMTLVAGYILMPTFQFEPGLVVIEFNRSARNGVK